MPAQALLLMKTSATTTATCWAGSLTGRTPLSHHRGLLRVRPERDTFMRERRRCMEAPRSVTIDAVETDVHREKKECLYEIIDHPCVGDSFGWMHRYCRCVSDEHCGQRPWPRQGVVCTNRNWTRPGHYHHGRRGGVDGRIPRGLRQFGRNGILRNGISFRNCDRRWFRSVRCDRAKDANAVSGDKQHNGSWQRSMSNVRRGCLGDKLVAGARRGGVADGVEIAEAGSPAR